MDGRGDILQEEIGDRRGCRMHGVNEQLGISIAHSIYEYFNFVCRRVGQEG